MISNFNTQALANSLSGNVPSGQTERADIEKVFKKLDSVAPADGPPAAVVTISAEGARRADGAPASPDVAAGKAADPAGGQSGGEDGGRTGGLRTGGQAGGVASRATGGSNKPTAPLGTQPPEPPQLPTTGAIASSNRRFEPADANRDGTVTSPEQQAYEATQAAASKAAAQATGNARSAEATAAVKAYASVGQLPLREDGAPTAAA